MTRWQKALIPIFCIFALTLIFFIAFTVVEVVDVYFEEDMEIAGKKYQSIESLHNEYADIRSILVSDGIHVENEIAFYVNLEDRYFVFSECHRANPNGTVNEVTDFLWVYTVKRVDESYMLESTLSLSNAIFYMDSNIVDLQENGQLCCVEPREVQCFSPVGFVYKEITDTRELYFDGVKMDEIEMVNPITDEPFILCYARTEKTVIHTFFDGRFIPIDKRHSIVATAAE